MIVYIQKYKNTFWFDGCYAAYEGAQHCGVVDEDIVLFEDIMEVPARRDVMVVACVDDTRNFFERVGIKEPVSINIPQYLIDEKYIRREILYMTLTEFMSFRPGEPMFVKPLYKTKAFVSGVNKSRSLLPSLLNDYKGSWDIPVLVSSVVDMVSEYRVYVNNRNGTIVGMKHYQGDCFLFPEEKYIRQVVDRLMKDKAMPASFSADFAVVKSNTYYDQSYYGDYRTELIEVQDGWAIGSYGLDGKEYFSFLAARWQELMKS